jgi:hypothetical protein
MTDDFADIIEGSSSEIVDELHDSSITNRERHYGRDAEVVAQPSSDEPASSLMKKRDDGCTGGIWQRRR